MKVHSIRIAALAILLVTQYPFAARAQSSTENSFHIGLVYPLSNHGIQAKEYSNVLSFHALAGVSKNEKAVSLAGIANIIKNQANGVQIAGLLNTYEHAKGFQLGGFANLAQGDVKGVQLAGFLNKAGKVHGVQFAGFINIADSSDYPIGILNIIKNGTQAMGVSVDENQTLLASFRSGGRVMYGIMGLGYNLQSNVHKIAFEAGLGAHLLTKNAFTLNIEVSNVVLTEFKKPIYSKSSIRLLPAYKVSKNMELFAGPSMNHVFTNTEEGMSMIKNDIWQESLKDGEMNAVNVGFLGGLQVYF